MIEGFFDILGKLLNTDAFDDSIFGFKYRLAFIGLCIGTILIGISFVTFKWRMYKYNKDSKEIKKG